MKDYSLSNSRQFNKNRFFSAIFLLLGLNCTVFSTHANVITSVKPIAFITEAVANNVTETQVLLPDGASPHVYALKPRDIQNIKTADLVIWIGEDMETFLPAVLKGVDKDKQIELMKVPAIDALLYKGEHEHEHEAHDHDHDHDDDAHDHDHHHHGGVDSHIWLSPAIAKQIAITVHDRLSHLYPEKSTILDQNLNHFISKLSETEQNIAKKLINVQNSGYFVFHDAYGYFERQFGLKNLGNFTINPDIQPGAQKVYHIRRQLIDNNAVCVFKEPQFSPAIIDKVIDGTNVRMGTLDPLAMGISVNKDAYFEFLNQLTDQYEECLSPN